MMKIFIVDELDSPLILKMEKIIEDLIDSTNVSKITPEDVLGLSVTSFTTNSFFILSSFNGATFDYLSSLKMHIFGPQLILDYFQNNRNLPKSSDPIFSAAMRTMNVSFTGVNKIERDELKNRVIMMNGSVSGDLTEGVTVVISSSVTSQKYLVASERGIPIMQPGWINALWHKSSVVDVIDPWDHELIKYRLPILFGLSISVTGLTVEERSEVSILLEKHGATYMPELKSELCTHLIARFGRGQKFLYARKWKIPVVSTSWLNDSIDKGYAQNVTLYSLPHCESSTDASTPKSGCHSRPNSLSSDISLINVSRVCDTMLVEEDEEQMLSLFFSNTVMSFIGSDDKIIKEWALYVEKHGGQVTNSLTNNEATHIIILDSSNIIKKEDKVKYVSLLWLKQCKDQNDMIDDAPFIIINENNVDDWDTMESYHSESFQCGFFHNLSFYFHDDLQSLDRDTGSQLISTNGGIIVSHLSDETSFIVTAETLSSNIFHRSAILITMFYLQKCVEFNYIIDSKSDFLFTPVILTESLKQCLRGCVISFSGYLLHERVLLKSTCKSLGAIIQDSMSRKVVPHKNILATTHLIILKVDKQKYKSSKSWNIPAVTKLWIAECVRAGLKLPTDKYLLQVDPNLTMQSVYTDYTLNDTCLSIMSVVPPEKSKIKLPKKPLTPLKDLNETIISANITLNIPDKIFVKPNPLNSEVSQVIINKHNFIRNDPTTPINNADISYGNLDTPIRRMSNCATREVDMDNLRDILKTPDYFKNFQRYEKTSFSTPDFERALKVRMEMLKMDENISSDLSDSSLSENKSSEAMLPLKSVVLYLSKSVGNASQMALIAKIEKLGGSRMWVYEAKTVTHVICNTKSISDRNIVELEKVIKDGKILVSAEWLIQCSIDFKKVDEEIYLVDLKKLNIEGESRKRKSSTGNKENDMDVEFGCQNKQKQLRVNKEGDALWQYNKNMHHDYITPKLPNDETQLEIIETHVKKIIMLSSGVEERDKYIVLVERMGGEVLSSEGNISEITHFVCSSLGRGEKFMAAMAAGKWILHSSYLDAVSHAGAWVDEVDFEYGGPRTSDFLNNYSTNAKSMSHDLKYAAAAHRWREIGGGAFKEWRVGIIDSEERCRRLSIIIECGGGAVVVIDNNLDPKDVTHILINDIKCGNVPVDLRRFQCYKMDLIQYLLTTKSTLEIKKLTKKLMISTEQLTVMLTQSSGKRATRRSSNNHCS